jgi:hypothetical protein
MFFLDTTDANVSRGRVIGAAGPAAFSRYLFGATDAKGWH